MVFVQKQCCNVKSKTTLDSGYLGSASMKSVAKSALGRRGAS
ncbi:unnamed protein product [Brassica napus]|nr:unnamed protein product [Brassica napus]